MNKEQEESILEDEVKQADDVQKLKDKYLDSFFKEKSAQLYEYIHDIEINDKDKVYKLTEAHHQLKSLNSLESEVQYYIDSGKIATHKLDELNK